MSHPELPLPASPPVDAAALARVHAAALAELRSSRPARSWRGDVALLFATTALLTLLGAAATFQNGWAQGAGARGGTFALLLLVQLGCASAALAPRARRAQLAALALALVAMAALVLARGAGAPSSTPEWVCAASHLALALGPLGAALFLLRRSHATAFKALAAGAAAGAVGAALGELSCGRGALHVALFHLPAWLAAIALTLFFSRRLRPHTYAD